MPPKNKIKIVDVDDKEVKNDDGYVVTVDEVEEGELLIENGSFETTEETTTIIQEKNENAREEVSKDTAVADPTKKLESNN